MSVLYLERSVIDGIHETGIREIIDAAKVMAKYKRLQDYYEGRHDILHAKKADCSVPNNKIVNNMARHVTDTTTGYFLGSPVVYSGEDEGLLQKMQDIFDYNDEQDHNMELAKGASIKGESYEMLYMDEDAMLRMAKVEPDDLVLIKESQHKAPMAAIRTVEAVDLKGNVTTRVEFWTWGEVWYFRSLNRGRLELVDVAEHYWQDVPFVEYINNEERMGDFEGIISIIDAYNRVQSNTANTFQYNDEALLKVRGLGEVESGDIKAFKEKGAVVLEEGGDVDWLLKTLNDTALENYKNRLYRDMHIFASVPNLADENFGNNLSGVAMDYKLWNLEQITAIKERKFKKGFQRRMELITRMLNYQGGNHDYRTMEVQFRRNKPQNMLELAQIFVQLASGVSHETRLKMLPMIENVQAELQKIRDEKKAGMEDFGNYDNVLAQLEKLKQADPEPPPDGDGEGTPEDGGVAA